MKTIDIFLDEMKLEEDSYDAGDITVENWNKKSFKLKDNVRFRIFLKKPISTTGNEQSYANVTSCYIIKAKISGATTIKDNSICFKNVKVTCLRKAEVHITEGKN